MGYIAKCDVKGCPEQLPEQRDRGMPSNSGWETVEYGSRSGQSYHKSIMLCEIHADKYLGKDRKSYNPEPSTEEDFLELLAELVTERIGDNG